MTELTAQELITRGYRRISNKYGTVARIDREDWLAVLAKYLHRSVAELYIPQTDEVSPHWCGFYRRVLSKDQINVPDVARAVPSSDHDPVGFIRIAE